MRRICLAVLLAALATPAMAQPRPVPRPFPEPRPRPQLQAQPPAGAPAAARVAVIEAVDQREQSLVLRDATGGLTTLFLGAEAWTLPRGVVVATPKPDGRGAWMLVSAEAAERARSAPPAAGRRGEAGMQAFARGLKPGDTMQVAIVDGVTVGVVR